MRHRTQPSVYSGKSRQCLLCKNGKLAIPKGNYYVEGVRIENNTISGKANGISLGDVKGATLSNNTITGCKRSGVQIADGSKVTISGGKIQKEYATVY